MQENKYLVLDIGGSSIKYAIMTDEAEFVEKGKVPTPLDNIENFIKTIGKLYDLYKDKIRGIAISMPGILDSKNGYAYSGGALLYNNDKEIVKLLRERCDTNITIENDGKCAALAEVWKGSLKECSDGIVIVLGTGIGGGIIKDRKIHKGKHFFAGEFSFMMTNISESDNLDNMWGFKNGSISLRKGVSEVKGLPLEEVDGYKVFEYANAGDEEVLKILNKFTNDLANQIINLQCVFDPEKIAIGGGISSQPILIEYIRKNLEKNYKKFEDKANLPRIEVEKCTFCNDSNLIGALYNFFINF
ncbi:sugar kinase [Clostridium gelidum]|uniref:Sugar kinase n=1 Tax=Clostridium gelidum TaxID=704125 RepID=A0ABN6J6Z9_9CLOT|nr:ROK family protein [Clostridium gelidum]BCZ48737.1 sugar kinase [Clostridium gelidum]